MQADSVTAIRPDAPIDDRTCLERFGELAARLEELEEIARRATAEATEEVRS